MKITKWMALIGSISLAIGLALFTVDVQLNGGFTNYIDAKTKLELRVDGVVDLKGKKDIDVSLENATIYISPSQTSQLEYTIEYHKDFATPVVDTSGSSVTIKSKGITNFINIDFFSFFRPKAIINLYIPTNEIYSLNIKSGSNKIEVTDLEFNDLNINVDALNLKLKYVKANKTVIDTDHSTVYLDNFNSKDASIKIDNGNLKSNLVTNESLKVRINNGSVDMSQTKSNYIDIKIDRGNIGISDSTLNEELLFKIDIGNAKLSNVAVKKVSGFINIGKFDFYNQTKGLVEFIDVHGDIFTKDIQVD